MIDRADAIIESGDAARLTVLWRHLVADWDSHYREAYGRHLALHCRRPQGDRNPRDRTFRLGGGSPAQDGGLDPGYPLWSARDRRAE